MTRSKLNKTLRLAGLVIGTVASLTIIVALAMAFRIHLSNEWQQYSPLPEAFVPRKTDAVLVFAPHSDDETLGCAGLIAMAARNGAKVRVALITNGDGFRIGVARIFHTLKVTPAMCIEYAYERQKETLAALAEMGIPSASTTFLGYPDRGIARLWDTYWGSDNLYLSYATGSNHSPYKNSFQLNAPYCGESLLKNIEQVIKAQRPTDVYVPHPADNHPDHYATYCFVAAAIEQLKAEGYDFAKKIRVHTYWYTEATGRFPRDITRTYPWPRPTP